MAEEKDEALLNGKEEKTGVAKYLKNKFLITILVFIAWIIFFDQNNLVERYKSLNELKKMKKNIEYYRVKISEDSLKIHELLSDKENLEKFAREEYLMKKDNEDVFIITED